jgi:hypothetical protein
MPMTGRSGGAARRPFWVVLAALVAGCGGGDGNQAIPNQSATAGSAEGDTPVLNEDEGAALADEAAADEAADMDAFGGNAAAGETGNGSRGGTAVPDAPSGAP